MCICDTTIWFPWRKKVVSDHTVHIHANVGFCCRAAVCDRRFCPVVSTQHPQINAWGCGGFKCVRMFCSSVLYIYICTYVMFVSTRVCPFFCLPLVCVPSSFSLLTVNSPRPGQHVVPHRAAPLADLTLLTALGLVTVNVHDSVS